MDNSTELIPINIVIADRNYRIKVAVKDEELVRKTIKRINDKILEFKTQFAGKDMQDYVAMVLVWYATQNSVSGNKSTNTQSESLITDLEKMDRMIREAIGENE
jgi:cell division protein ZapA